MRTSKLAKGPGVKALMGKMICPSCKAPLEYVELVYRSYRLESDDYAPKENMLSIRGSTSEGYCEDSAIQCRDGCGWTGKDLKWDIQIEVL